MRINSTVFLVVNLVTIPAFASTAFVANWSNWRNITNGQLTANISNPSALVVNHTTDSTGPDSPQFEHLKPVSSTSAGERKSTKKVGRITLPPISSTPKTISSSATSLPRQMTVNSPLQGFCHPLNGQGWLSQGIRGATHQGRMEFAYDLAIGIGAPVYAMRSGKVLAIRDQYPDTGGNQENATRFNYIWIEHDGGYRSIYAHLQQGFRDKVTLKAGDWVEAGQLIGFSGNSGWSSNPHLHIEVQRPSKKQHFTQTVPFKISGICRRRLSTANTQADKRVEPTKKM